MTDIADIAAAVAVATSVVASVGGLLVSLSTRRHNEAEAASEDVRARELEDKITQNVLVRANAEIEHLQTQCVAFRTRQAEQEAMIANLRAMNEIQAKEIEALKTSDAKKMMRISELEEGVRVLNEQVRAMGGNPKYVIGT